VVRPPVSPCVVVLTAVLSSASPVFSAFNCFQIRRHVFTAALSSKTGFHNRCHPVRIFGDLVSCRGSLQWLMSWLFTVLPGVASGASFWSSLFFPFWRSSRHLLPTSSGEGGLWGGFWWWICSSSGCFRRMLLKLLVVVFCGGSHGCLWWWLVAVCGGRFGSGSESSVADEKDKESFLL